ncbi:hypothetical protein FE257_004206 [Aspergillus nanangensis]|uniref:DNA (cytosine-5-)-methyltransferase n=1 Tax=Aspergillus nanangensis TaxID=2582783 RepID=A0AAD4CRQ9_ASPNN|nr:hypothetical protein FE257_004206 [Aspergillus nanangensis]
MDDLGLSRAHGPSENTIIDVDSDSDTNSSVTVRGSFILCDSSDSSDCTIENDPNRAYYIHETEENTQSIMDLTPEPQGYSDGDYLTDECLERLLQQKGLLENPYADFEHGSILENDQLAVSPVPQVAWGPRQSAVNEVCIDGTIYFPGQSVELLRQDNDIPETFLRITSILMDDDTGAVEFSGRHLRRAKDHAGTYIPKWRNELVWLVNETRNIPFNRISKVVKINFTSFCLVEKDQLKITKPDELFCRLKEVVDEGTSVEYITSAEADIEFNFEASFLRKIWRGVTQSFGENQKRSPVIVLDDIVDLTEDMNELKKLRQYTFGDAFCGAGGVSCGARTAGLHNQWAVDSSRHALATYRLNFQDTICEEGDIFHFLTNDYRFLKVDVTHGSPPCQTFSPAKTIETIRDDDNSACIFSCSNLIKSARPRVHTMEETSGLFDRHRDTFYRVIQDFLELGYSVRWSVINCMDYGVPQCRRRLIIIASGPGERLPKFPRPSHGFQPSLAPYTTINRMISNIPLGTPDHDVAAALSREVHHAPYDGNQQARTITTGGGDNNYHPSGLRGFTNREFACLQTFPLTFRFGPREVRKQIGNAVPPVLAEALYREIVQSLQTTDEEELSGRVIS